MTPPPLHTRIRNGTLAMLVLTLTIGAFAVPRIHELGGSIRETLYRNYVSIEAAQHMHAALNAAELAQLRGSSATVLPWSHDRFTHWINVELSDITEVGEDALAHDIQRRGQRIFSELRRGLPGIPDHQEFYFLESIEDGIALIDSGGVVTHINDLAGIILGVKRDQALGSPFDDLSSNHPHYLRVRSALRGGATQLPEPQRVEVDLHVRGRNHTYVLKAVPLRHENGQSFGTILILQDITYLRDKDQARTDLVATLSHELKTPLTSLALSAELLQRSSSLSAAQRAMVCAIREDAGRMTNLANGLLDLARGEGAAITLQTIPVDLTQLLKTVTRTFALQAEQKPVRFTTDFDQSAQKIRADPVKLSWVVSNLIANALRYTPVDGTITLSSQTIARTVRLQVCDTGPGIAAELRERLFERFAQWNVNGAQPGSAGLGLAIAKEIVEAHGGRIFVDSTLGKGTCFTVELPAEPEALWQRS